MEPIKSLRRLLSLITLIDLNHHCIWRFDARKLLTMPDHLGPLPSYKSTWWWIFISCAMRGEMKMRSKASSNCCFPLELKLTRRKAPKTTQRRKKRFLSFFLRWGRLTEPKKEIAVQWVSRGGGRRKRTQVEYLFVVNMRELTKALWGYRGLSLDLRFNHKVLRFEWKLCGQLLTCFWG